MLARLNFLLAVSASVLIAFYIVGRFALVEVVERIAPALVPYFVAAYALAALMLTVLALAKTVIRLDRLSAAARHHRVRVATVLAQLVLCVGHLCVFLGVNRFFTGVVDGNWAFWLLALVLYVTGIVISIAVWRKHSVAV